MITNRIETSLGSFEILDETNEPEFNAALIAQAPYLLRQRNELLAALKDADYLLRKLAVNWKEAGSMRDSAMRSSEDARAIIASVEGK